MSGAASGDGTSHNRKRSTGTPGDDDERETLAPNYRDCAPDIERWPGISTTGRKGATSGAEREARCWRSASESDQPSWPDIHPVPELPHIHKLEADPDKS